MPCLYWVRTLESVPSIWQTAEWVDTEALKVLLAKNTVQTRCDQLWSVEVVVWQSGAQGTLTSSVSVAELAFPPTTSEVFPDAVLL